MLNIIFAVIASIIISGVNPLVSPVAKTTELSARQMSMEKRYSAKSVNDIFRDNILLAVDYMTGKPVSRNVDWNEVTKPAVRKLVLEPGETFAFHEQVLPEYEGKVTKTSNSHFIASEGYKFSGALWGDGVCHLASLLYWTAKDAGLETKALVRHDFATIPEVPREYGVSIFSTDKRQNLYITNNKDKTIAFVFNYDGTELKISAEESI